MYVQSPAVARAAAPPTVNIPTAALAKRLCLAPVSLRSEQVEAVRVPAIGLAQGAEPGRLARRATASFDALLASTVIPAPRAKPTTVSPRPPRMIRGRTASGAPGAPGVSGAFPPALSWRRTIWAEPGA